VLTCTGCDDDDDFVDFAVSCTTVSCFNVDRTDSFINDEGTEVIVCEWFCANYHAFEDAFVELTFERRPDSCFELRSEFVSDGMCSNTNAPAEESRGVGLLHVGLILAMLPDFTLGLNSLDRFLKTCAGT
jgi:hypothetical protein